MSTLADVSSESARRTIFRRRSRGEPNSGAYWWRGVLIAAVTISISGNVYHALLTAPPALRVPAAITAAIPPLAVFGVSEGLMRSAGSQARKTAYRAGVVAAVCIALIAFVMSFTALQSLEVMLGAPPAVAAGLPLLADLLVAASGVMLLSFRPADPSTVAPAADSGLPEGVTSTIDATAKKNVIAETIAPAAEPITPQAPESEAQKAQLPPSQTTAETERPAARSTPTEMPADQDERRPALHNSVTPITAARTSMDSRAHYQEVAEVLVNNHGLNVRRGTELIAAVLSDKESGMRNSEIAGRHEVHHSVVKRILEAADQLAAV